MRKHKYMAQTGHALVHKTWFCHDPVSRLEKIKDKKAESWLTVTLGLEHRPGIDSKSLEFTCERKASNVQALKKKKYTN